jgi:hypothetical protein
MWGTTGPYERLSHLLVDMIRTGSAPDDVGRRHADEFRPPSPTGDAVADVRAAMARHGFEPEVRSTRDGTELVLHACPFESVAAADRETVCALHLGIAEGLVQGTDVTVTELVGYDPRVARCRLRMRVAPGRDAGGTDASLTLRGRTRGSAARAGRR